MDPRDLILVAVRWMHAAAAVALVGGSAFYYYVLAPALLEGGGPSAAIGHAADRRFRELVDLSLVVFLISGVLMTFDRLSSGAASTAYAIVLGIKVLLSFLLYGWAFKVRRGAGWQSLEAKLLVGAGFGVVLLASLLKTLYEGGLRS